MDLSHWDLVNEFTMREAACLAGGVEPLLYGDLSPEQRTKADLIYREIASAFHSAESAVSFALNADGHFSSFDTLDSVFEDWDVLGGRPLPSIQMIDEVRSCIEHRRPFNHGRISDFGDAPVFSRERLGMWFSYKGYRPIYSFIRTSGESGGRRFEIQSLSRQHVSDRLAKLNQAAEKFWANADRDDRGTHPDNAAVTAWLIEQGFSQTLADKAATIIRPEWAPLGRKPDE